MKGIEDIKEKMHWGITINRVPKKTYDRFRELASMEEFCKDYGFLLKYLIDVHDGIMVNPEEKMLEVIEDLNSRINQLELKIEDLKKEKNKPKSMLGGEKIK